jgi:cytochrome c553
VFVNPKRLAIITVIVIIIASLFVVYRYYWPESIESVSQKWAVSTHSNANSQSFTHWDEDEPPIIPQECAKCHSTYGYRDYLGADGSAEFQVDAEAETGSVIFCSACHNPPAHEMTSVTFPSEVTIDNLESEAMCMQCHQGLRSTGDVEKAIEGYPDDQIVDELEFINVHYQVAGATLMGNEVRGGYQYSGQVYVDRFEHAPTVQTCVECHDPHSQQISVNECTPCHVAVVNYDDLQSIRASENDYDGDGDNLEGIAMEIEAVHQMVHTALQDYARQVIGTPLVYANQFPYFFVDTDNDGEADQEEIAFNNQYPEWTPRLVRTAYNYHFVQKDPGGYVHNPHYVLQLLYDSLADLNEAADTPVDSLIRPEKEEAQ